MKNLFLFVAAATMLSLAATAQPDNAGFTIEGFLKGVEDGVVITLARSNEDGLLKPIASATVYDGRFTIKATAVQNEQLYIHSLGTPGFPSYIVRIWTAPGKTITVSGSDKFIATWKVTSDIPEQIESDFFTDILHPVTVRQSQLSLEQSTLSETFKSVYEPVEKLKSIPIEEAEKIVEADREYYDKITAEINRLLQKQDSLKNLTPIINVERTEILIKALKQREVTEIWLDYYNEILQGVIYDKFGEPASETMLRDITDLYDRIPSGLLETKSGSEVARNYNIIVADNVIDDNNAPEAASLRKAEAGEMMVDIDFYDLDGNVCHLADYLGSYILLDFWAYWCGPCVRAMPELKEVSASYGDALTVVSISKDTEKQWRMASDQHDITWKNLNAAKYGDMLWDSYGISGIPHYVLIAPDGKVVTSWTGYAEGWIKSKLAEFITTSEAGTAK